MKTKEITLENDGEIFATIVVQGGESNLSVNAGVLLTVEAVEFCLKKMKELNRELSRP